MYADGVVQSLTFPDAPAETSTPADTEALTSANEISPPLNHDGHNGYDSNNREIDSENGGPQEEPSLPEPLTEVDRRYFQAVRTYDSQLLVNELTART